MLCERHKKDGRVKLPTIYPMVLYADRNQPYSAPMSLWKLFRDSEEAKLAMEGGSTFN